MRTTTDLTYNVTGQTFAYSVREGQPTSATYKVVDYFSGDDDTAEFSGTATVESVTTTVDAASGRSQVDPQKISLASTGSITTSNRYLISEGSKQEWVTPIEIVSGDYIRVREPLRNDYTTAATFVGTTLTGTVDATWVADLGNISDPTDPNPGYRVIWTIVLPSGTIKRYSFFDLVRAPIRHQVDIDDVNERAPGLADSLPIEYQAEQGRPLVEAGRKHLEAKLASLSLDSDAIRDDQVFDELIILATLVVLADGGWAPLGVPKLDYMRDRRSAFDRFLEQHLAVVNKHHIADGTSGGAEVPAAKPFWAK